MGVKFMGHSVHPMLIVFPLGLLATAAIFDVVYVITESPIYSVVAYWMIVSGLIGGAIAALFGWLDWTSIPAGTRAKSIGVIHGLTNSIVLLLFLISVLLRGGPQIQPGFAAIAFSWIGVLTALVGGWLGGELVERLGVGVDAGANVNAPNSLSSEMPRMDNVSHLKTRTH